MKLTDLLNTSENEPEHETSSLRKLVRQKSLKANLKTLSKKRNPKDENHNAIELVGDGTRDELAPTDSSTVNM
jgi:hypothetical protein